MAWMACVLHHAHAGRRRNAHAMHCAMYYATHCGVHCGTQVRRAPLALYAARYGGGGSGGSGAGSGVGVTPQAQAQAQAQQQQQPQPQPLAACFPEHTPDRARSRWYSFPAMRPDELLLFTQYGDIVSTNHSHSKYSPTSCCSSRSTVPYVLHLLRLYLLCHPDRKLGHTMHLPCLYRPQARSAVGAVALRAAGAGRGGRGGRGRRRRAATPLLRGACSRATRGAAAGGAPPLPEALPFLLPLT